VSVTLVEAGRPRTAASTGELAAELDQQQYDLGCGPCLDAALSGRTASLPGAGSAERYRDLLPLVRRAGLRSIASVALSAQPHLVAGLNVYTLAGPDPHQDVVRAARDFADCAAATVAGAALLASATQLAEQLQEAMATRAVIEQAKGLLVARLGCTPEWAFDLLSEQSQQTNHRLREITAQFVRDAQRSPHDHRR
jgi:GAF domain-containing protein